MSTRMSLSLACLVLAAVCIPMILGKVPPNSIYGFRTRLTLSSPDIWYPANRFSGRTLLIAAGLSLATLLLLPERFFNPPFIPLAVVVVPLLLSLAASLIYLRRFS
jgi:uncharacterized membrane protein